LATGAPIQRRVPSSDSTKASSPESASFPARVSISPAQGLGRCGFQRLGLRPFGAGIGREAETVETAQVLAFDKDIAVVSDLGFEHRILSQAPHQNAGAAVDETLREFLVQRVG
jgi:hypothetical protein